MLQIIENNGTYNIPMIAGCYFFLWQSRLKILTTGKFKNAMKTVRVRIATNLWLFFIFICLSIPYINNSAQWLMHSKNLVIHVIAVFSNSYIIIIFTLRLKDALYMKFISKLPNFPAGNTKWTDSPCLRCCWMNVCNPQLE